MSRVENLRKKVFEIEIDGEKIKVKPKVKYTELWMEKKFVEAITGTIKEANPTWEAEDIEIEIATHITEYMREISILFGFSKREDYEDIKKEIKKQLK